MKKKFIGICLLIVACICATGCFGEMTVSDSSKFKEEYESLNGVESTYDFTHRTVSIDEDNPFVYATADDILTMAEEGKTFYVYFGDKQCPWCRSVIEKAIEVAKENNIDTIYYVNIWDDDHNEILRDKYQLNDDGELEKVSDGAENYSDLLKLMDSVLDDYTLTDDNDKEVQVGEKRIYAPDFVYFDSGKATKLETGISDKQESATSELSDEILEDEQTKFEEFFAN